MALYDGTHCVQVILDEPPTLEWNQWCNQRVEYYKRLEPNEPVRDVYPVLPKVPNTHKLRFSGPDSDQIWRVLYTNPDEKAIFQLDALAKAAIAQSAELGAEDFGTMRA